MFGFLRAPWPLPVAADQDEVREHDFVWKFCSDTHGQCSVCSASFKPGDALVAVGRRDSEARPVMHADCFRDMEAA